MATTEDRKRLVALLEQLSRPCYWQMIQERWTTFEKHREWSGDFASGARRAEGNDQQQQADACRRFAAEEESWAEKSRQLAHAATNTVAEADALIRAIAPQFLGYMPPDDLQAMRANSPDRLATQCKTVLGLVLATETIPGRGPSENKGDRRKKKSTTNGDAKAMLLSHLCLHHEYDPGGRGSVKHPDPIGCKALARLAEVSDGSASKLFKPYGGHRAYLAMCRDSAKLADWLSRLCEDETAGRSDHLESELDRQAFNRSRLDRER